MYEIFIGEEGEEREQEQKARDQSGERAASPEKQKLVKEKEPERLEDGLALDWDRIMVRVIFLNVIGWKPRRRCSKCLVV